MRYKLGDLVELVTETNSKFEYGLDDIVGVTLEKQMIPTRANLTQTDLDSFILVHPKDFVYNPRTHGKKIGLGFNTTERCFISTWNNNVFRVKPSMGNVLLPEYLYMHFLRERWDKEACFNAWGSSTVVLLWNSFCNMAIDVPSIDKQRWIVHAYQVITDRISLLEHINQNLLLQAESVFNKFYNESKEQKPFTSLINVLGGGTPETENPEFWGGSIPFFTPKDVGSPYTIQTEKSITESGLNHCSSRLYPENTSFVTARGTVGKVSLAGKPMAMNQSCYALASETIDPILVYFYALRTVELLKHKASGAVFDAIVTRDFDSEIINVLSDNAGHAVLLTIAPMMKTIHINTEEGVKLASLKDALLSDLISGKQEILYDKTK